MDSRLLPDSFWDKLSDSFVQRDIRDLFELNKITAASFLNIEFKDLETLGVKYFSDRKRLIDAQRSFKRDQPGKGNRTDIHNLEASWNAVEQWRKKKAPFGGASGKKKKDFHVTEMCFNRQNQLAAVKGKIPQMVSSVPALAEVKLACWNQFQDRDDLFLPNDFKISITDNTKKRTLALIKNDAQLVKATSIGYLCEEKKEDSDEELSHTTSGFKKSRTSNPKKLWNLACFEDVPKWTPGSPPRRSETKLLTSADEALLRETGNGRKSQSEEYHFRVDKDIAFKKPDKASFRDTGNGRKSQSEEDHFMVDKDIAFKKPDLASVEIEETDINILQTIGKGQFGKVYRGYWKGLQVAIKEIPKGYGKPDLTEIDICRHLRHPNVVMLFGCTVTDTDVLIVTNYIKGCNLAVALGLVEVRNQQILDNKFNGYVLYTAAQGVAYIHERGIIHQDLKPANIMVEEPSKRAIICDLGLAKIKSNTTTATQVGGNAGTPAYQHLEQILGKRPTTSVDVYSFGVITMEVYTRTPAWYGLSYGDVTAAIKSGSYPSIPAGKESDVPDGARAIIEQCFQGSEARPTLTAMLPLLEGLLGEINIW